MAFVASQVVYILANEPLCKAAKAKVDGSFLATLLETVSVVLLVVTWTSVTEGLFSTISNSLPTLTIPYLQKHGKMIDITKKSFKKNSILLLQNPYLTVLLKPFLLHSLRGEDREPSFSIAKFEDFGGLCI